MLYTDMMQYRKEHPDTDFSDIYMHFAGQHLYMDVTEHMRNRYLIVASLLILLGILISVFVILSVTPIGDFLLHYAPIFHHKIQH